MAVARLADNIYRNLLHNIEITTCDKFYKLGILTIKAGVDMVWCPVIDEGSIALHQENGQPLE